MHHNKHAAGAGAWPPLHVLQLVLSLCVLQPLLLVVSVVDFGAYIDAAHASALPRALLALSAFTRRRRDGVSLALDLTYALQNVFLVQMWTYARLSAWARVAEGRELGEYGDALKKRRLSTREQLEGLVYTTIGFPFLWLVALATLVLAGAPLDGAWRGTATLAAYLLLLSLFPLAHLMGFPPSAAWYRVLSGDGILSRELLVLVPGACAWLGTWAASAALALDWGRAWQAWPVPSVYGALAGVIIGNYVAVAICILRVWHTR